MTQSLYSPNWYKVASLRPKLRNQVKAERQSYRGQTWYLLRDGSSGRHHRINEIGYQFAGRLDGRLSVEQLWHLLAEELGERSPTQDELIQILVQLNELELIQTEHSPEFAELFRRRDQRARKRWTSDVNPLAFRVRLFDPSIWLARGAGLARLLFNPGFLLLWLAVMGAALLATKSNWELIIAHAGTHMLTPRFLLLTWLSYPFIKLIHEFAHAFAVKVRGGEVREMGVRLLFLTPVPYVDASSANGFSDKWQRISVSAAGIMAELWLAAMALFVWLNVGDGLVRDVAFVIMVIGGVSTVFFNGNPLLRFDGYYMLADALDLPNLAQRSNAYWGYLAQRYLCGLRSVRAPAYTLGERGWFLGYGLASLAYRWFVSAAIVFWISATSATLALILAAWFLFAMLGKPALAIVSFLLTAPQLAQQRARAIGVSVALVVVLATIVLVVPVPSSTVAQGVVWLPEDARLRARTDGFVREILVQDGSAVRKGEVVLVLEAPDLEAQLKQRRAELESFEAQYQEALGTNPAQASALEQERNHAYARLDHVEQQLVDLRVKAPADGVLAMPRQQDLQDSFVKRGAVLAHVITASDVAVRVAVAHEQAALVRERHRHVAVHLLERGEGLTGQLLREVPAAGNALPSAALSDRSGGSITTDPQDADALRTLQPMFLFDVAVPTQRVERVGARAWVRFDHGSEPLAKQWGRSLRQLVLRHFAVRS